MIISLIGFMGCGKSSVGRRLSELLCCPFMDLDHVIEDRAGRTIPEIFSHDGEPAFRRMELEELKDVIEERRHERLKKQSLPPAAGPSLCGQRGSTVFSTPHGDIEPATSTCLSGILEAKESVSLVLALGGGAVMTPECAEIVHSETICIYLRASVDTLMEHLEGQTANRPLLNATSCHSDRAERVEESALRDRITDLMAKRSATYENTAHIIIDTDGKSIEAFASEILSTLH